MGEPNVLNQKSFIRSPRFPLRYRTGALRADGFRGDPNRSRLSLSRSDPRRRCALPGAALDRPAWGWGSVVDFTRNAHVLHGRFTVWCECPPRHEEIRRDLNTERSCAPRSLLAHPFPNEFAENSEDQLESGTATGPEDGCPPYPLDPGVATW